jgi:hypothetical protein
MKFPMNLPSHLHKCLICKGEFLCWGKYCLDTAIVCDECVEDQIERAEDLSADASASVINLSRSCETTKSTLLDLAIYTQTMCLISDRNAFSDPSTMLWV